MLVRHVDDVVGSAMEEINILEIRSGEQRMTDMNIHDLMHKIQANVGDIIILDADESQIIIDGLLTLMATDRIISDMRMFLSGSEDEG